MNVTKKILKRDDDINKSTKKNVIIVKYTDNFYDETMKEEINYWDRKWLQVYDSRRQIISTDKISLIRRSRIQNFQDKN